MKKRYSDYLIKSILSILSYTFILIISSFLFKSFKLNYSNYFIYPLIASTIIYILNKTIKPILVFLTLPITAITLGIFYPVVNLIIFKITDWMLGEYFIIDNLIIGFFMVIFVSILNIYIDTKIIRSILRRLRIDE